MPSRKPSVRQPEVVLAFAARLRAVRQARGMTQRDLAEKAAVTFSYISRLEAGGAAPGIELLDRLAGALGVGMGDLLPGSPADGSVDAVRRVFEAVIGRAGPETVAMLRAFLDRLADSPSVTR